MNRKTSIIKRATVLTLSAFMAFTTFGCGSQADAPEETIEEAQIGINGYVYIPEYTSLGGEDTYYSNMTIAGTKMYYSSYVWDEATSQGGYVYYCKDLTTDTPAEELPVNLSEEMNISQMLLDESGNMYFFLSDYTNGKQSAEGYTIPDIYLYKADSQGNEIFNKNITEDLSKNGEEIYIQNAVIDGQNRIYATAEQQIFLFDAEGNCQGAIETTDWINEMGVGKDGKVYITQSSSTSGGMDLIEINFETRSLGTTYANFPYGNGNGLCSGIDHDFLINDGAKLVGYNLADQSKEDILDWIDSDINGQYVDSVQSLEDGRLMAIIRDWDTGEQEIAYLTKTEVSQVAEKEIITIGVLSTSQDLQNSAVKFNKSNGQYRIKIKDYLDYDEWTETTYSDAITALNNDILSGNGPDIMDLSQMDIANLVSKGAIEDLTSYLEQSQSMKKEDFVQSVLDAYTVDGVLTCIPTTFYISTVIGRSSQVGEEMGWSIDEMIAFIEDNPDAEVFDYADKSSMLSYCMMFNRSAFIDSENGSCNFDSDEFKKVLEFANKFPSEYNYDSEGPSTAKKIMDGQLLLNETSIDDPEGFSVQLEMFGNEPVTCIGFPTVDGSIGNALQASNCYGIMTKSGHKEGAWAFLEYLLQPQSSTRMSYRWGFSTRQSEFDEALENATEVQYILDENGEPILDEEGNPIEQGYGSWGWNDITIEARALTEVEAQMLREVVESARLVSYSSGNDEILNIINEEAAPYFEGQKTVDEVVSIIQSRVKMYISENS